jgi:hypothetical protein
VTPPGVAPAARAAGAAVAAAGATHRATINDNRDKKGSATLRIMLSSVGCIPGGRTMAPLSTRAGSTQDPFFVQHRGYGAIFLANAIAVATRPKMMLNLDGQCPNNASEVCITRDP